MFNCLTIMIKNTTSLHTVKSTVPIMNRSQFVARTNDHRDSGAIQSDMVVSFEVLMAIRFCVIVVSITTPCKLVGGDSISAVHATPILKAEFNNEYTSKYFCPLT